MKPPVRSEFAADDGGPDPALTAALAAYDADGVTGPVVAALARSRLLVPVVAVGGDAAHAGSARATTRHSAELAAVLLQGRDGRRALLAFSSVATLAAWRPEARPVPLRAADAARAAADEGAAALVVDVAGPVTYAVEGADLEHLCAGHRLVQTSVGYGWLAEEPADG